MNCRACERLVSDELDGRAGARAQTRLARHLETCPACRAYRSAAAAIQRAAADLEDPAPPEGYWAEFDRRLRAGLAAPPAPAGEKRTRGFGPSRRWAWAAAAFLLVLAGGIVLFRPAGPGEAAFPVYFRTPLLFDQAVGADDELAETVNGLVLGSIGEAVEADAEVWLPGLAGNPLFWEGLSDEDLKYIEAELRREIQRGG